MGKVKVKKDGVETEITVTDEAEALILAIRELTGEIRRSNHG